MMKDQLSRKCSDREKLVPQKLARQSLSLLCQNVDEYSYVIRYNAPLDPNRLFGFYSDGALG